MIPPAEVPPLTSPLCCEGRAAPGQIQGKGGCVLVLDGALGTRCAQRCGFTFLYVCYAQRKVVIMRKGYLGIKVYSFVEDSPYCLYYSSSSPRSQGLPHSPRAAGPKACAEGGRPKGCLQPSCKWPGYVTNTCTPAFSNLKIKNTHTNVP